ncbi:helix-turn-helix domain-containing protein [Micromonospora sp. LOL_023]|uniref:helix-turn-helix domain-containing protein n=1 Tax=Micromonospora sp. LOL_023 TaxID=3345418 RepID=UPI003A84E7C4
MADRLVTPEEVAARLRVTPRFVRRLVADRRIEYVKVGRLVRFEESAVAAYVERNRIATLTRANLRHYLGEVT